MRGAGIKSGGIGVSIIVCELVLFLLPFSILVRHRRPPPSCTLIPFNACETTRDNKDGNKDGCAHH